VAADGALCQGAGGVLGGGRRTGPKARELGFLEVELDVKLVRWALARFIRVLRIQVYQPAALNRRANQVGWLPGSPDWGLSLDGRSRWTLDCSCSTESLSSR
jgi:hypothetical protein